MAYDKIKACRQQAGRTSTDLLDYMRPLWEELGSSVTPEMKMLEYSAALRPDIQAELERLPLSMRATLPMIEEQANIIYRRKTHPREQKDPAPKVKQNRRKDNSGGSEGEVKTPKKAKKKGPSQRWPKRDKPSQTNTAEKPIICYKCGEPGHKVYDCINPAKPGFVPREPMAGKEKGQKD